MGVIDKNKLYKIGVRFPDEICSPWDVIKAIEWALEDHVRRFHNEGEREDGEEDAS